MLCLKMVNVVLIIGPSGQESTMELYILALKDLKKIYSLYTSYIYKMYFYHINLHPSLQFSQLPYPGSL